MAEGVVDAAEPVEVEVADPDRAAAGLVERGLQPVEEHRAVGEAGEGVVVGVEAEAGLEVEALGDVLHEADHVARLARGTPHEREGGLHADRGAVAVQVGALQRDLVALAVEQAADLLDGAGLVVEAGEHVHVGADEHLGIAAEHRAERPVDLDDLAADRDDHDPGGGVAEDGAEAGVVGGRVRRQVPHACDVTGCEGRGELRSARVVAELALEHHEGAFEHAGLVRAHGDQRGPDRAGGGRFGVAPHHVDQAVGEGGEAAAHGGAGLGACDRHGPGVEEQPFRGVTGRVREGAVGRHQSVRLPHRPTAAQHCGRANESLPSRHPTRRADDARDTDTRPGSARGVRPRSAGPSRTAGPGGGHPAACRRW